MRERSVAHLLERYDELAALWLSDQSRLKAITKKQGRLILAIGCVATGCWT